jgi:hypothetical protein
MAELLFHLAPGAVALERLVDQAPAAGGVVEQDQGLAVERAPAHRRLLRQLVRVRHHQHEGVVQDGLAMQVAGLRRLDDHAEIDFAAAHAVEHVLLDAVEQQKLDARRLRGAGGDAGRHQVGRQRGAARHAHLAAARAGQAGHVLQGLVEVVEHALQPGGQRLAGLGQHHFARGAVEQLQAKLPFELEDGAAHRRLAQAHLVARAAEVAALGHRTEDAKLAQSDIHA